MSFVRGQFVLVATAAGCEGDMLPVVRPAQVTQDKPFEGYWPVLYDGGYIVKIPDDRLFPVSQKSEAHVRALQLAVELNDRRRRA